MNEKELFESLVNDIKFKYFDTDTEAMNEHDIIEANIVSKEQNTTEKADLSDINCNNMKLSDLNRIMVYPPQCEPRVYNNAIDQKFAESYRNMMLLMRFMYVEMGYLYLLFKNKENGTQNDKDIYKLITNSTNFQNFHHTVYYNVATDYGYYIRAIGADLTRDGIINESIKAFVTVPSNRNFADLAFVSLSNHRNECVRKTFEVVMMCTKTSISDLLIEVEKSGKNFCKLLKKRSKKIDEGYYYNDIFKKLIELYMIEGFNERCIRVDFTFENGKGFLF